MADSLGAPDLPQLRQHVRTLGIISVALGAFQAVVGLLVFFVMLGVGAVAQTSSSEPVGPALGIIGAVVLLVILVLSLPMLITGIGLLKRRSWSRILAFIVGALNLTSVPLGTAYGLYAFWIMTRPGIESVWEDAS